MKVLVTGGAGFIGSHLVDGYLEQGLDVFVLDNLYSGDKSYLPSKVKLIHGDIRDDTILELFKREKFDIINHHAAQMDVRLSVEKPSFDAEVNIIGTLNLLEAAIQTKVSHFIFISSGGAVYGDAPQESFPLKEEYPINPLCPYGVSKHTLEHYLYLYAINHGLNYHVFRYANVFGPRQGKTGEAGVISIFLRLLLQKKPITIFGDGGQVRDYVYIDDVVKANMLLLDHVKNSVKLNDFNDRCYNIGTGIETSVNQLYKHLTELMNIDISAIYDEARPGELYRNSLDSNKFAKEFSWEPQYTVEKGLKPTLEWFKEKYS